MPVTHMITDPMSFHMNNYSLESADSTDLSYKKRSIRCYCMIIKDSMQSHEEDKNIMKRKRRKKYRMAVGACGPTILYTNVIRAYSPEEAARKYLEDEKDISEERITEIARRMREIEESKPLKDHYDCCGNRMEPGDTVMAAIDKAFIKGKISKLTNRSVKIMVDDREYSVTINKDDHREFNGSDVSFFAKLIKLSEDMVIDNDVKVGSFVAFIESSFGTCRGLGTGTVTRITPGYVYIDAGEDEIIRKTAEKVKKLR